MTRETRRGSILWLLLLVGGTAVAREPQSGRLVVEEKTVGEARPHTLSLSFSASSDGEHYGYLACSSGAWRELVNNLTLGRGVNSGKCEVVVDGKVFGPYGGAFPVRFGPADARYFFVAAPNTRNLDETFLIVRNGTEGPLHEGIIGPPSFSPDGERIAFAADTDGARVFVDETSGPKFRYVWTNQPFFCGDGQGVAYAAKTGDGWAVVQDGVVRGETTADEIGAVQCLPNGTLLYDFRRKKEHFAVLGSEVLGPYEEVRWVELSPDREHYSYVVKLGKKREVAVHDGKRSPEFEEITGTVTSSRGVAILAKRNKRVSVVFGEKQSPEWDELLGVQLSSDGARIAAVGRRKKQVFLWIDGVETPRDTSILYLEFSPNAEHLLAILEEKDALRVAIDDAASEAFLTEESPLGMIPRWIDNGTAVAYGRKNESVVRRTFKLAPR